MHETIAAQDGVAWRQRVRRDIGEMIFTIDFSRGGAGPQALDQRRHDVDACITHTEIGLVDPACIAAGRIEQRSHAEFFEQPRQFGTQHGGCIHFGAQPRSGCFRAPQTSVVDMLKPLRKIHAGKGFLVLKEAPMRKDRRTLGIMNGHCVDYIVASPFHNQGKARCRCLQLIRRWGTARPATPKVATA